MQPENELKNRTGPEVDSTVVARKPDPNRSADTPPNPDQPTQKIPRGWLRRFAYLAAAVILVAVVWLARGAASSWLSASDGKQPSAQMAAASQSAEAAQPLPTIARSGPNPFLAREIVSHSTEPADFRAGVITYTVQSGDFLFAIADKFKITPETILWSNYAILKDNPELLIPGQVLNILPVDGLYYQWQAGDRLDTVAGTFGVTPEDIIFWPSNDLAPTIDIQKPGINPGTWLVIPGGHREFKEWEPQVVRSTSGTSWTFGGPGACNGTYSGSAGTGVWSWPTASHWVVGNEWSAYHHGIDLYIMSGDPIYAADRGVVVYAGWNTWGYGYLVVIDHGNGWQTVYAHLKDFLVGCGSIVQRGEPFAHGDSTGNSTGPHLHFEMIYNTVRVNPHLYLP